MEELYHFNHFFEIFAGINAALLSFDESRKFVYSFFSNVIERRLELEYIKIKSVLVNVKETLEIINELDKKHTKPPDNLDLGMLAKYLSTHVSRFEEYKKKLSERYEDRIEFDKVKTKIIPTFVFCFLYCLSLIILAGVCESSSSVHHSCFIFLAYYNSSIFILFLVNETKKYIYDLINYFKINVFNLKVTKEHGPAYDLLYVKIRRNVITFIFLISLLPLLTYGTNYLLQNGWHFPATHNWAIIIMSFCICPTPTLLLIYYARQWANNSLKPILTEYIYVNKEMVVLIDLLQNWMDNQDILNKIEFQVAKINKAKPQNKNEE